MPKNLNKVFVVAYENLGSSSGFAWYPNEKDAEIAYESEKKEAIDYNNYQVCIAEYQTETLLTEKDKITKEIDCEIDLIFKNAKKQFPHTKEEWSVKILKLNKHYT